MLSSPQHWLPTRTTWVSLMQNSWRNPPLLWCPPQHQPTPPFLWMWSSTSEFRYHHSSIFKPRGFNGWIVLLSQPTLVGQVSGPVCFFFCFFFSPQPSQIRFSCLPMSRVECMLKLPSLDLVFSSNRGERENPAGTHPSDGSHPASSTPPGQHIPKTLPSKGLQNCAVDAKILTMQLCSLSKLKHVLTHSLLCSSVCHCAILCCTLV